MVRQSREVEVLVSWEERGHCDVGMGSRLLTMVLLVESTVATPPAEGVGLGVPLTVEHRTRLLRKRGAWHWTNSPEGGGT